MIYYGIAIHITVNLSQNIINITFMTIRLYFIYTHYSSVPMLCVLALGDMVRGGRYIIIYN